jgi:hypothetical protein
MEVERWQLDAGYCDLFLLLLCGQSHTLHACQRIAVSSQQLDESQHSVHVNARSLDMNARHANLTHWVLHLCIDAVDDHAMATARIMSPVLGDAGDAANLALEHTLGKHNNVHGK